MNYEFPAANVRLKAKKRCDISEEKRDISAQPEYQDIRLRVVNVCTVIANGVKQSYEK
jgi:hypothetical protein